jgi:dTDP-4-dehydrorhamnose reductase
VVARVVVTGAGGLLGGAVANLYSDRGARVDAFDHRSLDITNAEEVHATIERARPDLIVHCAAMTNVDACESDPDAAFAVNGEGSHNIANAASHVGAKVALVSTDYVFDGTKGNYTEDDETNPIQVYGESKLAGEHAVREGTERHFIVRSAWIYGPGGKNFISKLPALASQDEISAVNDQRGSPTYAPDLAEAIAQLAETEHFGTFHVVNSGFCSFSELCRYALQTLGAKTNVKEVEVASLGRPAPRPHDTTLVGAAWTRLGFAPLRSWREAVTSFVGAPGVV